MSWKWHIIGLILFPFVFFFVHTIEQIFRLKTQRATRLHEWTAIINLWVFA
jgi:hypothetical protein